MRIGLQKFKELVKKHGVGMVIGAVTFYGYRRQIINDRNNNALEKIAQERNNLDEEGKAAFEKRVADLIEDHKNKIAMINYQEAADAFHIEAELYNKNLTEFNKVEVSRKKQQLDESIEEIYKLNIFDSFYSMYTLYTEYLDNLTLDKIVCLFNIIIGSLALSSYLTVISILLSEKKE